MEKKTKNKLIVGGIVLGIIGTIVLIKSWKKIKPIVEIVLDDFSFDEPSDKTEHSGRA